MEIETVDALTGQRAALTAPAAQRETVFRELVMEPLRPYWEPLLTLLPANVDQGDQGLEVARSLGYYTPDLGIDAGLEALDRLGKAKAWPAMLAALDRARETLAPEAHGVPLDHVRFSLVLANPARVSDRLQNYTGFGGWPGLAMVLAWPTEANLPRLPGAAAHELHHNVRLRFEPWTDATTVGQYLILEGMAEAFVAELFGEQIVGPWATALSEAEALSARRRLAEALEVSGFDAIRGYLFGDWAAKEMGYAPRGLPDFAGFTIGYELVRAYTKRTGRSVAEATYVPWREIVAEAAYL